MVLPLVAGAGAAFGLFKGAEAAVGKQQAPQALPGLGEGVLSDAEEAQIRATLAGPGIQFNPQVAASLRAKLEQSERAKKENSAFSLEGEERRRQLFADQIARAGQIGEAALTPEVAQSIAGIATGQQAGAGQALLNAQQGQNLQNALSIARSQAGVSPAQAARLAGQQAAGANVQAAQQAAIVAAQEQQRAQQLSAQLGTQQQGVIGGFAGQDLSQSQQAAQIQQQLILENMRERQRQRDLEFEAAQINQQTKKDILAGGLDLGGQIIGKGAGLAGAAAGGG